MPLPVRRDYFRGRQQTGVAGAWVITIGKPANALEGDLLIAHMSLGANNVTVADLSGWQQLYLQPVNSRMIGTFVRRIEEDDPANYSMTLTTTGVVGMELSVIAISDAADVADWTIGTLWRRQDNGGSQVTTQSPSISAPADSLVLSLEIEVSSAVETDGSESINGATKWFGSPTQTVVGSSLERVLVSYIEATLPITTPAIITTWPNASANGAAFQIAIPYASSAPDTGIYAKDTFERTVASGSWGAADIGGNWANAGTASYLSVANGKGVMTIATPGGAGGARLTSIVNDDVELYAEWTTDSLPQGETTRPRFITRSISGTGDYHVRGTITPTGGVDFRWYRDDVAGLGSAVALPGTYTPGDVLKIRAQTFPDSPGVTRLRARMWYAVEPEPTSWAIDLTDATPAYQVAGYIGINAGLNSAATAGPISYFFDNFIVSERQTDLTSDTGNIGIHVVPHFTQTSLRVGAKFINHTLTNEVRLYDNLDTLIDTKTPIIPTSKWANVEFTGLTPNTEYTVKFFVNSVEQTDAGFTVFTLPAESSAFVIVAGSCQFTASSHPIFTRMTEDNPLFIAHMGDLHYQDAFDETAWRSAVESSLSSSTMKPMLEKVPFSWTWDNHDRIILDSLNLGSTSPDTVLNWTELAGTTGWSSSDTMGRSWTAGRVRFIQTDQWSVRDDPDLVVEPRTFLGATQKQWWKNTLLAAEEPIIIWFCQWTAQNNGNGRWNSFNTEVTELEDWLNAHPSIKERLVMVGGDSHQLQADSGTRTRLQGSRFSGVPSLNVSGFNRSSTGAGGLNWDIAEASLRLSTEAEASWGAYSRLTFNDNGHTIAMLWEAVRVDALGNIDIMASWERHVGTVTIDGNLAISQYYHQAQSRIQPLSIEISD
jgi:hypothetical protein